MSDTYKYTFVSSTLEVLPSHFLHFILPKVFIITKDIQLREVVFCAKNKNVNFQEQLQDFMHHYRHNYVDIN